MLLWVVSGKFSLPEVATYLWSLELHPKICWLYWFDFHCPSCTQISYCTVLISGWILPHSGFHLTFCWNGVVLNLKGHRKVIGVTTDYCLNIFRQFAQGTSLNCRQMAETIEGSVNMWFGSENFSQVSVRENEVSCLHNLIGVIKKVKILLIV